MIDFNIIFKQLTTRRRKKSYFHRQMTSVCFIYITNVTQALTSGEGETVAVATLGKAPGRVYNYSIQDSTNPWIWRHVVQSLLVDLNTYRFINENRVFFKDGYKFFFEFGSRQVESWKKSKCLVLELFQVRSTSKNLALRVTLDKNDKDAWALKVLKKFTFFPFILIDWFFRHLNI